MPTDYQPVAMISCSVHDHRLSLMCVLVWLMEASCCLLIQLKTFVSTVLLLHEDVCYFWRLLNLILSMCAKVDSYENFQIVSLRGLYSANVSVCLETVSCVQL